jgi:hypothetical protein
LPNEGDCFLCIQENGRTHKRNKTSVNQDKFTQLFLSFEPDACCFIVLFLLLEH